MGTFGLFVSSLLGFKKTFALSADLQIPKPFGSSSLQDIVASLINVAFVTAGIVALIYIIIGGYNYITSSGNPEQATQAKSTITYAIIGLIVVFVSFLIVRYVLDKIGVGPEYIPSLGPAANNNP